MIIVRSPLRISLGGGGTDLASYYANHGGFLLAAAIDKYVYVTVSQPFNRGSSSNIPRSKASGPSNRSNIRSSASRSSYLTWGRPRSRSRRSRISLPVPGWVRRGASLQRYFALCTPMRAASSVRGNLPSKHVTWRSIAWASRSVNKTNISPRTVASRPSPSGATAPSKCYLWP